MSNRSQKKKKINLGQTIGMSLQKSKTKEEPNNAVLDPHEELFDPHEEVSDESEMTGRASPFVYMLVICVCIGGFLFGYDTGGEYINIHLFVKKRVFISVCVVISGALGLLHDEFHMSKIQKELVVGGTTFGAIFGGFFSGLVSRIYIYICICKNTNIEDS
jgi:SP family myo-inositol transporter-like MFS transporter 13